MINNDKVSEMFESFHIKDKHRFSVNHTDSEDFTFKSLK